MSALRGNRRNYLRSAYADSTDLLRVAIIGADVRAFLILNDGTNLATTSSPLCSGSASLARDSHKRRLEGDAIGPALQ